MTEKTYGRDIASKFYPEIQVAGFSHVDSTIAFYTQINALLKPEHYLLDYGAGRGEPHLDDPVGYRTGLQRFKGKCAHVDGCDVDPVVLDNPSLDHAKVIKIGETLDYADQRFDIIVSRYVFEHVDTAEFTASELLRITKPGGWICAITPNKWSYMAFFARMIPNRMHVAVLRVVQPWRNEIDVFPTRYKMNSFSQLCTLFSDRADVFLFRTSAEPAYHFQSRAIYAILKLLHKLLPSVNHTTLCVYIRKHN
jgi:SAM-dependent methyltransferase